MQTTIYLVRHGETEWNKKGKLQGWLDSPLTEEGKNAALALQKQLKNVMFDDVFASDLERAVETAMLVAPSMSVQQDARLREIFLGEWQGQRVEKLQQTLFYQTYTNEPHLFQPTNQESFAGVTKRMMQCLEDISVGGGNILVVSHGVAIMCLLAHIKGLPLAQLWDGGIIPGATVIRLQYNAGLLQEI
ncbi:histidine phosphatase family protein [Solibacillus sp. CAU 1738]|uniref:histidine phosphatase family protein n=1 Tax=Solibacillus sp. CAU 1738 TaxID=3140363 RepID=UPI0032601CAF